jgi:phenylalanyl-tRNA synthetase beta chain
VVFELDLEALSGRPLPMAHPLPRQQSALRDLALVVGEGVTHDALIATLTDDASGLVRSAHLFDLYKPKAGSAGWAAGERSMAVRLELRDDDATLTDERIESALAEALARVGQRLGARLRA